MTTIKCVRHFEVEDICQESKDFHATSKMNTSLFSLLMTPQENCPTVVTCHYF